MVKVESDNGVPVFCDVCEEQNDRVVETLGVRLCAKCAAVAVELLEDGEKKADCAVSRLDTAGEF